MSTVRQENVPECVCVCVCVVLSCRVASMLMGPCRMSRGELVLVLLPKLPEWWLLNVACARAGIAIIIIFFTLGINDPEGFWKKIK